MRLKITNALRQLRRDLARLNELLFEGDSGAEYLRLAEVARASNDPGEGLFDADLLPELPAPEPPDEELAADLDAVWERVHATLRRPPHK